MKDDNLKLGAQGKGKHQGKGKGKYQGKGKRQGKGKGKTINYYLSILSFKFLSLTKQKNDWRRGGGFIDTNFPVSSVSLLNHNFIWFF